MNCRLVFIQQPFLKCIDHEKQKIVKSKLKMDKRQWGATKSEGVFVCYMLTIAAGDYAIFWRIICFHNKNRNRVTIFIRTEFKFDILCNTKCQNVIKSVCNMSRIVEMSHVNIFHLLAEQNGSLRRITSTTLCYA